MKMKKKTIDELLEYVSNLEEPIRYSNRRFGKTHMEQMRAYQFDYNLAMFRLQNLMQKTTFAEHIKAYEQ